IKVGERNNKLASFAGVLRNKGLSQKTIEESLLSINRNECVDPLTEDEVLSVAKSISNYEAYQEPIAQGYKLRTLREIFDEPEKQLPWIVDELLIAGGLSILGGKPKAGKSTLARYLALCVATGDKFLGRICEQGPVLYLAFEEIESEVKSHFKAMGATGDEPIYIHSLLAPKNGIEELGRIAEEFKPRLIIIDTLFRLVKVNDLNDYAKVTNALEPLLAAARQIGGHVMCVHHLNKGGGADSDTGDAILGSTAIFGTVDAGLFVKKSEKYRTLASVQRYGKNIPETVLVYDEVTRRFDEGKSKSEVEFKELEKQIIDVLFQASAPLSREALEDQVEGQTGRKRNALKSLVFLGRIEKLGKGGKSDPFRYQLPSSRLLKIVPPYDETLNKELTSTCSVVPNPYQNSENNNGGVQ
ncbi:MAG: uncharacterized protein JWQ35_1610, partial [Bacteriovoracaceae bacterium]|nr:uncharacterized protein [Bacteriovoracaceae bacterium]